MAVFTTILIISCQKEQNNVTPDTASASTENNVVVGVSGGTIPGLITRSDADDLTNEYLKVNGSSATQSVQFSIADLTAYITAMQKKYKSDKIYINFGIYNSKTTPNGNKALIGKRTIYFGVNNNKSGSSTKKDDAFDSFDDDYLNHGQLYP